MPRTRRQVSRRTNDNGVQDNLEIRAINNAVPVSTEIQLAPIASTSAVSVQTDRELSHWSHSLHYLGNRERSLGYLGQSSNSLINNKRVGDVLKLARDIIPSFDGMNMSVNMFIEHCRVAATSVDESDMHLLIMLVKNKVTGQARKHIQDKVGASLDEILKSLQRAFGSRADPSQLAQELAVITRKQGENVADYGIRVSDILNKIIIKVMEKNPGTQGLERCQEYKENAIKNFMRSLDRETLYFVRGRFPTTLDEAIELAAEADLENTTWNSVHGIHVTSRDNINLDEKLNLRKRVANIQSVQNSQNEKKGHYPRFNVSVVRNLDISSVIVQ